MFTFIESSAFERICPVYLDDDEYAELEQFLMQNPEAGRVVPGSGGVRKLRWARPGMGKRGGLRVIHFVRYEPNEFWMLTIYARAKRDDVPAHILKQLLEAFRNGYEAYREGIDRIRGQARCVAGSLGRRTRDQGGRGETEENRAKDAPGYRSVE